MPPRSRRTTSATARKARPKRKREWPLNPAYDAAITAFEAGDHRAAEERFREAIRLQPRRPRVHANLARALAQLGRLDEAVVAARRATKLAGDADPYGWYVLAFVLGEVQDAEGAAAAAERALAHSELDPQSRVQTLLTLSWALSNLERPREACVPAREAVALDPDESGAHVALCIALGGSYRLGEALSAIDEAIRLAPADAGHQEKRQLLLEGLGVIESALEEAEAKCAANPNDWEAHHAVGVLLTQLGRLDDAAAAFDRAHRLHPGAGSMLSHWEADCRLALIERGLR